MTSNKTAITLPTAVLAHNIVTATDTPAGQGPTRWMLFLHGLLGSRSNWRGIATRFVAARPDWGVVLVDLRMHGDSQDFAPPHTLASAARDLIELEAALDVPVAGVLGHSFGGKVALQYLRERDADLDECWIIDSPPGPRIDPRADHTTQRVIEHMRELPATFQSRNQFVAQITAGGFNDTLARWLALNLVRRDEGLVLRVDIAAIRALLESHYQSDLWPVVEQRCRTTPMTFVIGGKSTVFVPDQRERIEAMANAGKLRAFTIENAGHWVHADAPDALMDCLTR